MSIYFKSFQNNKIRDSWTIC